jgi:hypothetical protein
MRTTYYYGNIEMGNFRIGDGEPSPLAIIHRVNEVKEFDRPAEAWEHWVNSNGEHESYISIDAIDEFGVQYELVFKQHR